MSPLPFTIADMVSPIEASIKSFRAAMGLAQLTGPDGAGTGTLCVGPEYLNFQLAPPGIIIVPSAEELGHEYRTDGVSDGLAPLATKRYLMGAHTFEAWCWGDEDPDFATTQDTLYSFDSALELRRELLLALAQLGGIIVTIIVTRLFRSVGARWIAHRMIRSSWHDLALMADSRKSFDAHAWTLGAADRLGKIAARMALTPPGDALHGMDGLADVRIGRNLLHLRRAAATAGGETSQAMAPLFSQISAFFRSRAAIGPSAPPAPGLLLAIDRALGAIASPDHEERRHQARLALVGMRCNLFPDAPPFERSNNSLRKSQ